DSSIDGLLYYIPKLWAWALGRLGQIVPPLPLGADGAARDAALDAAADSLAAPFRRQILREIGPLARLSDAALDALPDDLSAHANELGAFNLRSEARKLVRPDVKRIADLQRAGSDRARLLDEVLLVAISDVIWDRAKEAEGTSGSLARTLLQLVSFAALFRQPTTRSVPGTRDLLVGLWETWRHHTLHDWWVPSSTPPAARAVAGFGAILPRLVAMAIQVFRLVWRGIADPAPVAPDTKNAFSAELMLGIGGVFGALKFPRRLQIVSGWELAAPPLETATRRGDRSDETLARQRLSFTVYPHESRRFDEPTAWGTIGLVPPLLSADGETVVEKPELLVAGLGNARVEQDLGGGFTFVFNVALGGGARLRLPWAPEQSNATMGGGEISFAVERPYDLEFGGATLHLTPSLRLAFGVAGAVEGAEPFAAIALTLNEGQDKLRVKPETDGFLARLLPVDGIPIPLDLSIGWHSAKGLHWLGAGEALRPLVDDGSQPPPATGTALRSLAEGQGQPAPVGAANFDPVTPMNVKLGLVTLDQRSVSLAFADAAGKPGILVDVKGRLTFSLGPVRLSIIGIGARLGGVLDAEAEGVDMVERVIDLQPPTGLALSITHAAFSGGGFLERIKQGTTTIWRGAVAFRIGDRVDVSAFGVVRTSPGAWSMLIFLAGDIPPVPLGLGFRLTGVGGALGLHRRMDDDALADSLLRGEPAAETLLFPEDPQSRLPELLALADRFFPAQHGTHVFGPLVELDWKLAGLKAARLRAALLFQLGGGVKAALVGAVKLGLPSLDHPYAFSATAGVAATYDHDAGELMLAVSITEAKLFSTINLEGGAALLARWGRDRAFAFTLGGFHPRFRPHIPAGLIEPRRLAAHWSPVDALRLDLEAYFAITHASVQAGGSASVWAGKSWGHAEGRVQVDLMIWWEPDFRLEADLSARLTLSLFGADLMSASFSGSLAGPKPWRFEGSVSWTTCGVEFSKDLSFGWGSGSPAATTTVAARELLRAELEGAGAWATSRPGRLPIILRPGSGEAALFPRDRLELRQTRLPLRVPVDASERNRLSDPGTWDVVLLGGGVEESSLTDTFPVQRYRRQKTDEPYRGGLRSGARYAGQQIAFAPPVADDTDGTEDAVIDDRLRPERVNVRVDLVLTLATGLVVAAPTRARDRAFDRYFAALKVSE
ncbi:MAG: hypothetical protein MUF34_00515, partial [Polyangiaceae bacterium]|nr:hypothetical protein [Polyangiaceae bacterium]